MKIPIIINNRNRLSTLSAQIEWFKDLNVQIYILDNNSTYEPLLKYYKEIKDYIKIIYLNKNIGHKALYEWKGHLDFKERYFIYTDSDIIPLKTCPKDLVEYLMNAKIKYSTKNKVGISLEINDLPDHFSLKQEVIKWESQYWKNKIDNFWIANIDTTLAMYDNKSKISTNHSIENCLRSDYPYVGKHEPWYLDTNLLNEEEKYYIAHANAKFQNKFVGHWTQQLKTKFKIF